MKRDEVIDEIKSRLDIVDVISEYLDLKKSGSNFKALCPFHHEKTPSFTVSPSKQFYYCFGCGDSGDVINFLKKIENISFNEAIQILSEKAGIKFDLKTFEERDSESELRVRLLGILKSAQDIYTQALNESETAMEYLLKERSLSSEVVKRFSLGYAPDTRDYLLKRLLQRGYDEELIRGAGLIVSSPKGVHDLLRNRIIFPIFNPRGDIIGFGGRLLPHESASLNELPKYINSPETLLFKKGENLFGLYQARDTIKKEGFAIITEGYMDVIMCHQYGFCNAVAPLGTALTPKQLRILKRLTDRIILLFDGDQAGVNATKRAVQIFLEEGLKPEIVFLPGGNDPDEFIRKYGAGEFRNLFEKTVDFIDFYLFRSSSASRTEIIKELIEIISRVDDGILRAEYIKRLSEKTVVRESIIFDEVTKLTKKGVRKHVASERADENLVSIKEARLREEELLLATIIRYPEKADFIFREIDEDDLEDPVLKKIFINLREIVSKGRLEEMTYLIDHLPHEEKKIFATFMFDMNLDSENMDKVIIDCLRGMKLRELNRRIEEARSRGDFISLQELIMERKGLFDKFSRIEVER